MKNASDRRAPKGALLAIIVVFIYLACFQFDARAAWTYLVEHVASMLALFGL